jgi:hypothetical protein
LTASLVGLNELPLSVRAVTTSDEIYKNFGFGSRKGATLLTFFDDGKMLSTVSGST